MVQAEETNPPTTGSANPSVGGQTSNHELRPDDASRDVFVVHGRNIAVRDELFTFLGALGLHPLEWSEAVRLTEKPAPYIGEILDAAFSRAHAVVVLFTPDDVVRLRQELWAENEQPSETGWLGQARPNVFFEAGMAMSRSEDRTVLVEVGTVKPFSDIAGRHVIRLNNNTARRQEFAQRLRNAGCPVNTEGTNWHTAGNLQLTLAPVDQDPIDEESARGTPTVSLSEQATELLVAAADDAMGGILVTRYIGGMQIRAGNRTFSAQMDRRLEATLEGAIRDLATAGLIERGPRGEYYVVTREGFNFVDALNASTPED